MLLIVLDVNKNTCQSLSLMNKNYDKNTDGRQNNRNTFVFIHFVKYLHKY